MIRLSLATVTLIAGLLSPALAPALAQERVTVGAMRDVSNGALFLAASRGYFKAEGLSLEMTAYKSDQDVATALAAGATDLGIARFTTEAFTFAGRGEIRAIAAQAREKEDYEGNELVASISAYDRGLRKAEHLPGHSVAIGELGSTMHYQFGRIASVKGFHLGQMTLKPQNSLEAIADAIASGKIDAAILPGDYARSLLTASQARLIAWVSQYDQQQLGALFASAKAIQNKRETIEKFLRAYRRGAAAYYEALMRHDKFGKRISNAASREAAAQIARYVLPGRSTGAMVVEADAYFIDPKARLDLPDITRQVRWYQSQGLIDKEFDPRAVVDSSFQ